MPWDGARMGLTGLLPADLAALDALVGTRWQLIGANCLTLLVRRWREDYRVR